MPNRSMLTESRALAEYWQLQASPTFRGEGIPKGGGQRVLVLPGLFGNDFYLQPLHAWLSRIGYQPLMSRIALNAGCPKNLLTRLYDHIAPMLEADPTPIAVIGHSRGGMLGKAIVTRSHGNVSHFVTLGSPVGAMLRMGWSGLEEMANSSSEIVGSSAVMQAGQAAMRLLDPQCDSPLCKCEYWEDLLTPLSTATKVTSIFSTEDPVVSPAACPISGATNIEVTGSHAGLVASVQVYPHIAEALAR